MHTPAPRVMAALAALAACLAACTSGPDGRLNATDTGTGAGALLGGLAGSQFGRGPGKLAAVVVGAVAGGIIGNTVGRNLDDHDRALAQQAEYDALERGRSGQPERWSDPQNGRYGEIVPQAPYQRRGRDCRDYAHTVYVEGRPETMHGTACRDSDGSWHQLS